MEICRGAIIQEVDLGTGRGSEQSGKRPCVVISNDVCNRFSPTITVAALTSKPKKVMPTHMYLDANLYGLLEDSIALLEQPITIDKSRILSTPRVKLTREDLLHLDYCVSIQMGLIVPGQTHIDLRPSHAQLEKARIENEMQMAQKQMAMQLRQLRQRNSIR